MRDDSKILTRAVHVFESANTMSSDRFRKRLVELIANDNFLMAIFRPTPSSGVSKEDLRAIITQVYDAASKRSTVSTIAEAISEYGYSSMSRTSAVFLVSLVNLGMATIDSKASDLGRAKDHGEISSREFERNISKLNDYQDDLNSILKYARRIVKSRAKELSARTGLPKEICVSALFTVPNKAFLDNYKIGFYLQALLGNLYGYVNLTANEQWCYRGFDRIDWNFFFAAIFGSDRLPDVASLILLEGVSRIDHYENADVVRECWDTITQFALKALNKAPATIRDQMIELYLKRLNKMLADHSIDLRVDLRTIDNFRFENLASTISKYKSAIDNIMGAASSLANARPEASPT